MKQIIEYIPYELQGVKDYQEISKAMGNYCQIKFDELDQLAKNRNILTSDEDTIKQYEEMLGIIPKTDATLDDRRYAIWLKMNSKIPYTEQWLRHWLTNLLGADNYRLTFNYGSYSFLLKIALSNANKYDTVVNMLDAIVPAHLNYIITYLYNTWEEGYSNYNWETAKQWTWEDALKNENF